MEGFYALLLPLKYFDYGLAGKPRLGLCNGMDLVGIFYFPALRSGLVLWSLALLHKYLKNTMAVEQFSAAFGVTTDDYIIMMSTISILGSPAQLITSLKLHLSISYVKSHGFSYTTVSLINSHMTQMKWPFIGSYLFFNSFLNSFLFIDQCINYFRFFVDLVFFLTNFAKVSLETLLLANDVCTFTTFVLFTELGKPDSVLPR